MRQRYRNLNLQSKLMITYLIIISIPMLVIAFFLYSKVYNMTVADTIREEQARSSRTAPAVEDAINRLLTDFDAIQELPFYRQVMSAEYASQLDTLAQSADGQAFPIQVHDIITPGPARHFKIYLDLPAADIAQLNQASAGIFEALDETENTYWKGIFSGANVSSLHCPDFYLSSHEIEQYGDMAYITREYLYINHEFVLTYNAMYYSSELYLSILEENLPLEGGVSYIINDRDAIIATTNPALSSTYYLNYATIQDSFMSSNNFLQKVVLEETIYAGMYNIKQPGWYMLVVTPSKPLLLKSRQLMYQYAILFLSCIAIALFLAISLSRSITRRLSLVITQMAKVRTGPPIPLEESHVHDEIGELIDTYNYMSREMNHLLKEMEKAGEDLRIAEFRSLQAQINPHFLYNTMDMINWMAVQNRTSEIADAVQNLSRFYKLTLSKKEILSTIAQEVEHVSIYLHLQNMRYLDSIEFVADISDELLDYEIPKLTLQPIVENAVLHGIMEKEEKAGTIVLTGWKEAQTIVLLISDDGVGIAPENLSRILLEKNSSQKGTNIAVYNTHHRLQILYGEQYGLTYASSPGQGTEVSIRIPAKKKKAGFPTDSLIQVTDDVHDITNPELSAKSSDLLNYNEKLSGDIYQLRELHRISEQLSEEESIYILSHHLTEAFPAHTHKHYEMVYCCRGSAINEINGTERIQSTGTLYILHPDAVHSVRPLETDDILINFAIQPERFAVLAGKLTDAQYRTITTSGGYLYFSLEQQGQIQSLLSLAVRDYAARNFHESPELHRLFTDMFDHLSQCPCSDCGPDRQCHDIITYVKDHCMYVSLEEISLQLNLSQESITALIARSTGQPPEALICQARLEMAVSLMRRPELSLDEIASACGYPDARHLNQAFGSVYPLSMEEFRKRNTEYP